MKFYLDVVCPVCGGCQCDDDHRFPVACDISDDNIYRVVCPDGHQSYVGLRMYKFEILFEMGSIALIEGYYREAVANFVASLERFLEFYIDFACYEDGIDVQEFKLAWKQVSSQSERQIGAFLFSYLRRTGKALKYLDNKNVQFRNEVIHKGYIPNFDETFAFGQAVLEYMDPIMFELEQNHSMKLREHERRLVDLSDKIRMVMSYMTLVCFGGANQTLRAPNFKERLEESKERMNKPDHEGITARPNLARFSAPLAPGFAHIESVDY
jgi:hypothetical protein